MTWRAAKCLITLRDEINAAHPNRDKSADGIIGDQAHQQRTSDHNPDANGVVHAIDITTKPGSAIDADTVVEWLRTLGKHGDPRLAGNGYIIYRRRIASAAHAPAWEWHDYTGTDPHEGHFHLSCTHSAACDDTRPWGLYTRSQEDDLTPEQATQLAETWQRVKNLESVADRDINTLAPKIAEVLQAVKDNPQHGAGTGDVDPDAAAKAVVDLLTERLSK